VEVLAGAETHGVDAVLAHGLEDSSRGALAVVLTELGIGVDDRVDKLTSGLLKSAVRVVVVGRREDRGEPSRLGVREAGDGTGSHRLNLLLLAFNLADTEALVLGLEEDLVAVETKEDGGSVLAGWVR
jgi:hypothetical protein